MKRISLFAAALAAGLIFPVAGAAQQAAPHAHGGHASDDRPRAERPRFTDAQREQMHALRGEQRKADEAARAELRGLRRQLAQTLSSAQIDGARVDELKTQIAGRQAAAAASRIEHRAKVAALLTPDQRQAMGERGVRGQVLRQRGQMRQRGNDAQLRQRIETLERQLEDLRKKIG